MSDTQQGPDWWLASDGKWYPPQPSASETGPAAAAGPAAVASSPPPPPPPRPGRLWQTKTLVILTLAALILGALSAGGSSGSAGPDKATETKLAAATDRVEELEKAAGEQRDRLAAAERKAADAVSVARTDMEVEFAGRKAELDAREQAVAARELAAKNLVTFGDGVWEIGVDIQPGKYKTEGSGDSCYWSMETQTGDIIANDNVSGPVTVVISTRGGAFTFKSSRCGTWTKTG